LPETTGVFRLFLPRETLAKVNRLLPAAGQSPAADLMTWGASLSGGRIELGLAEFSDLEPGDILLFAEDFEVLLPPYPSSPTVERGWKVRKLAAWPFRGGITKCFERSLSMQGNTNKTGDPFRNGGPLPENLSDGSSSTLDLSGLPVRLHVILGQIELSLSELNSLTCNSVIELDRAKGDPVQIAVNGKVIGSGLLVEIEGMLGVEISKWSGC
jgi:type III secretion system YscQ/HrcQ family protein